MKYRMLFLAVVFFSVVGFAQEGFRINPEKELLDEVVMVVTYNLKYQQDSTDAGNIREERMVLLAGNTISLFQSLNQWVREEMLEGMTRAQFAEYIRTPENRPPSTRFKYHIFKNYPEDSLTITDFVMGDNFRVAEDLDLVSWEIGEEQSEIQGYRVQKATTRYAGRTWTAWFAPEIPVNDGPYIFSGLPGLILEVNDTRNHYVFEMVSIERPSEPKHIKLPTIRYIETSRCNLLKAHLHLRDDIVNRAGSAGLSSEAQQVAARNMRRRNNPLELSCE